MNNTVSQRGQRYQFDVVVIGSGIAGLSYSLELLQLCPHIRLALLSKGNLATTNSYYAQGGIAAADGLADLNDHIHDTQIAGDGLCNSDTVATILAQGPASIEFLQQYGVAFSRDSQQRLARGREAGHSSHRIYHVADQTGQALINALSQQLKRQPQLTLFEQHTAVNLITQVAPHQPGHLPEVIGVYVLAEPIKLIHTLLAKVVVLATGGAGKVYRYTSNTSMATGDGVAMAYRAGARVGGLEFYQFHPTLLYHPKINNFLISEALRGEGAYLRSPSTGERFMQHHAAAELATRDVVARAIFSEIEQNNSDYVHLDCRHQSPAFLQKRFPMIHKTLQKAGLELSCDLIPVVPAAHYMGGGVLSDTEGKTDLKRLLAIGEVAFTGLHGANRLASNSLLEGVVMGRRAAQASTAWLETAPHNYGKVKDWDSIGVVDWRRASQINVHWRGLRSEMHAYAGIVRTEAGLRDQLQLIATRSKIIESYYWKHSITRELLELRNIILVAELVVRCALRRRESRGGHYRADYPSRSPDPYEITLRIGH